MGEKPAVNLKESVSNLRFIFTHLKKSLRQYFTIYSESGGRPRFFHLLLFLATSSISISMDTFLCGDNATVKGAKMC